MHLDGDFPVVANNLCIGKVLGGPQLLVHLGNFHCLSKYALGLTFIAWPVYAYTKLLSTVETDAGGSHLQEHCTEGARRAAHRRRSTSGHP